MCEVVPEGSHSHCQSSCWGGNGLEFRNPLKTHRRHLPTNTAGWRPTAMSAMDARFPLSRKSNDASPLVNHRGTLDFRSLRLIDLPPCVALPTVGISHVCVITNPSGVFHCPSELLQIVPWGFFSARVKSSLSPRSWRYALPFKSLGSLFQRKAQFFSIKITLIKNTHYTLLMW